MVINANDFKNGYQSASEVKTTNDMHQKFSTLEENQTSDFMLGYGFYLMENAKLLDGASSESLSAKVNIGLAKQCMDSALSSKNLDTQSTIDFYNKAYELAGSSLDNVINGLND